MGKGDRRSRRGKIRMGSYGNSRRRKNSELRFVPKPRVAPVFAEVKETVAPIEADAIIVTSSSELATVAVDTPKKIKEKKVSAKKTATENKTEIKKTAVKKAAVKKTPVKKTNAAQKSAAKK